MATMGKKGKHKKSKIPPRDTLTEQQVRSQMRVAVTTTSLLHSAFVLPLVNPADALCSERKSKRLSTS